MAIHSFLGEYRGWLYRAYQRAQGVMHESSTCASKTGITNCCTAVAAERHLGVALFSVAYICDEHVRLVLLCIIIDFEIQSSLLCSVGKI